MVNGKKYRGKHTLIAVGGLPKIRSEADVPGANFGTDSDGFFRFTTLPEKCVVVGAGYVFYLINYRVFAKDLKNPS